MNPTTFEYLEPTAHQKETMSKVRGAFAVLAAEVDDAIPPGVDKDYVMRLLRDAAMWSNVAITRRSDGTPRQ